MVIHLSCKIAIIINVCSCRTFPIIKWRFLKVMDSVIFREVEAGLMEVKPDIIISVHPLMQHIPLWVLKWQRLQKKVIFVTVITDLTTCHPTW